MKTLIINIETESALEKILSLAKKLKLRTKVLDEKNEAQEHAAWIKLGIQNLANAYDNSEPDISGMTVREPNPKYKP